MVVAGLHNPLELADVVVAVSVRQDGADRLRIQPSVVKDEVSVDLVRHLELTPFLDLLSEKILGDQVVSHGVAIPSSTKAKVVPHGEPFPNHDLVFSSDPKLVNDQAVTQWLTQSV